MLDIMPVWCITLPIESNSSTVKHTASGVTLHQNIFGIRFDPIRLDVFVNVSGLMRVIRPLGLTTTMNRSLDLLQESITRGSITRKLNMN